MFVIAISPFAVKSSFESPIWISFYQLIKRMLCMCNKKIKKIIKTIRFSDYFHQPPLLMKRSSSTNPLEYIGEMIENRGRWIWNIFHRSFLFISLILQLQKKTKRNAIIGFKRFIRNRLEIPSSFILPIIVKVFLNKNLKNFSDVVVFYDQVNNIYRLKRSISVDCFLPCIWEKSVGLSLFNSRNEVYHVHFYWWWTRWIEINYVLLFGSSKYVNDIKLAVSTPWAFIFWIINWNFGLRSAHRSWGFSYWSFV